MSRSSVHAEPWAPAVHIRMPDAEETPLSPPERLVAVRENVECADRGEVHGAECQRLLQFAVRAAFVDRHAPWGWA